MSDLKFALRQLVKNPGFTAVAVLTLALGIGANTAMFSFLNSLLLRPPPFPRSDELVRVFRNTPQHQGGGLSPADFLDLQRDGEAVGEFAASERSNATLDDYERPTPWVRVTPNLFGVLQVLPSLGRGLRPDDAVAGGARVVLISHWLWQDHFGGATDVLGKTIRSGGISHEIVGVLPPPATDRRLFDQVGVFSPLVLDAATAGDRTSHRLSVLGRPRASVSGDSLKAFLAAQGARLAAAHPGVNADTAWETQGLPEVGMSPTGQAILWMLLGLSGFVLLIACSNLANFLLARTLERSRDLAVRAALGASRRALLRPLLWEAVILAALGGAGALLVSGATTRWLLSVIWSHGGPALDFAQDSRVWAFAAAVSFVTILFFGTAPAMLALRINAQDALKNGARGGTPGRGQRRLTRVLIAGQCALALVLLAGAGFFVRGAIHMLGQDYGWNSKDVLQCNLVLPSDAYPDDARVAAFQRQLAEQAGELPGVTAASVSTGLPFLGLPGWSHYVPEGQGVPPGGAAQVWLNATTPTYFQVTGTRLLSGRLFSDADTAGGTPVALINEAMARAFFPGGDAVGRRIAPAGAENPRWLVIIGVVADARSVDVADRPGAFQLYTAMSQGPSRDFVLAVRADGTPAAAVLGGMRAAVARLDPAVTVRELMTADRRIAQMTSQFTMVRQLLLAFAGLGLFLATLGIYGMIARSVVQRTGEIGIRMALGAAFQDIVRLFLGSGIRVAVAGAAAGALGALGLAKLLSSVLPAMQTDPAGVVLAAALVLVGIAAAASWLPTRRAGAIQPADALRAD